MKLRSFLVLALALMMSLVLAGCDEQQQNQDPASKSVAASSSVASSSSSSSQAGEQLENLSIKVYYPDDNATGLVAVEKDIKVTQQEKYKAAVEALMAGTDKKGLVNVFPKKAQLLKVSINGNVAQVDFNKSLEKDFAGGSTGEEMLVGSVVNTLTEFPEIKKVQILIEGKEVETLSGHMDLSQPLTRMEELIK